MLLREIISQILTFANISLPLSDLQQTDFVVEAIESNGFSAEQHDIWTDDGYQLRMQRITNAKTTINSVLLVHGLLSCGGQWVANKNKSLAFMLSKAGYDVWILNHRGTSLSNKHKILSHKSPEYWNFSFHELGYYDIPAAIDYVLSEVKKEKLHVIGHSQGATGILAGIILRPEYNTKIISSYIFNPAVLLHHLFALPREIVHNIVQIEHERDMFAAPLRHSLLTFLIYQVCHIALVGVACTGFLSDLFGGNNRQAENPQNLLEVYIKFILDNASVKQMDHFVQIIDARRFQMYDYGPELNQKLYNASKTPPEYNLAAVEFPVTVMYGTIDGLTTAIDVRTLIRRLKNIEDVIVLPWNHLDIIHSKHADKWLNERIINSLNKYSF